MEQRLSIASLSIARRNVITRLRIMTGAVVVSGVGNRYVYGPRRRIIGDVIGRRVITGSIIIRRTIGIIPSGDGNPCHAQKCQYQQCQHDFFHPKQPP
jgi:hypothetical protein